MTKEFKQKWIKALRSGKYNQGKGKLRSLNSEYCCLGVACDISEKGKWDKEEYSYNYTLNNGNKMYLWLNCELIDLFGISSELHNEVMKMNDEGRSFEAIAEFIERSL